MVPSVISSRPQKSLIRHRRWVEYLKDYDLVINYHLLKVNVVANALIRKSMHVLMVMFARLSWVRDFVVRELTVRLNLLPWVFEAQ